MSARPSPAPGRARLPRWRRWLFGLEHLSLRGERRVARLVGSSRLNPLPHTGTIGILLLTVVVVTGVYLTLFYQFGFEASYEAVAGLERHPVQRVVRAAHRYASMLLVLNTLVHGWKAMVAARFTGSRWLSWATGTVSLLLVWVAGVSGYWLVWDERAEHLNAALGRLLAAGGRGVDFMIDFIRSSVAGSGWLVLLGLLTVHILATVLLGTAIWLHVRRTRHRLLPPRHWMALVLGPLVAVSIAWPVGMLEPAELERIAGRIPLDPFFLFLLPAVMSWSPWAVGGAAVLIGSLATALPLLVGSTSVDPVILDTDLCTGCELCVHDCPYDALSMSSGDRPVAVLDEGRCVACGICVGSCSFDALAMPGQVLPVTPVAGHTVVIACSRHVMHGNVEPDADAVLYEVTCCGMLHTRTVAGVIERGASDVSVIGCAPGDCSFGIGNRLAADRLRGDRAPFLGRRYRQEVKADWVSPLDLGAALHQPGSHDSADPDSRPLEVRKLVFATLLTLATVLVVAALGLWQWGTDPTGGELLVVVDHVPGQPLSGADEAFDERGVAPTLRVKVDGGDAMIHRIQLAQADRPLTAVALVSVPLEAGPHTLSVSLESQGAVADLFDGSVQVEAGRRVVVEAHDSTTGSIVDAGRALFSESRLGTNVGCQICHSLREGDDGVGPSLWDVGLVAAERVPDLSAAEYIRQSIIDPDAYVVDGFSAGQMLGDYEERLDPEQLDALVAFLLSLQGSSS